MRVVLHQHGKCVGVVDPDGRIVTHNMVLPSSPAWREVDENDVPKRLRLFLIAAKRRIVDTLVNP